MRAPRSPGRPDRSTHFGVTRVFLADARALLRVQFSALRYRVRARTWERLRTTKKESARGRASRATLRSRAGGGSNAGPVALLLANEGAT